MLTIICSVLTASPSLKVAPICLFLRVEFVPLVPSSKLTTMLPLLEEAVYTVPVVLSTKVLPTTVFAGGRVVVVVDVVVEGVVVVEVVVIRSSSQ